MHRLTLGSLAVALMACGPSGIAASSEGSESGTEGDGDGDGDIPLESCAVLEPDVLPGLSVWLRADLGVSEDDLGVRQWLDAGPAGRDAARLDVDPIGPTLVEGALNGHPVLRFFGDSRLFFSDPELSDFTVFEVGRRNGASEFSIILGPAADSSANQQLRYEGDDRLLLAGPGAPGVIREYAIGDSSSYHSLTVDGDGPDWSVYRDGDFVATQSDSLTGVWRLGCVGSWFGQYFLDADVAELIIFDRSLSTAERDSIQCYLDERYGL